MKEIMFISGVVTVYLGSLFIFTIGLCLTIKWLGLQ